MMPNCLVKRPRDVRQINWKKTWANENECKVFILLFLFLFSTFSALHRCKWNGVARVEHVCVFLFPFLLIHIAVVRLDILLFDRKERREKIVEKKMRKKLKTSLPSLLIVKCVFLYLSMMPRQSTVKTENKNLIIFQWKRSQVRKRRLN